MTRSLSLRLLSLLLALLLPLQGMASAMACCPAGSVSGQPAAVAAAHDGCQETARPTADTVHPATDGNPVAAIHGQGSHTHGPEAGSGSDGTGDAGRVLSCCHAVAVPVAVLAPTGATGAAALPADRLPAFLPDHPAGGPDRPPRTDSHG